jgi:O-antigen ligase
MIVLNPIQISPAFRNSFYILLLIQILLISISIAVSSIAFSVILVLSLVLAVRSKRWPFPRTIYDWFFAAFIAAELLSTAFSEHPELAIVNSKRILLMVIVYVGLVAIDNRRKLMTSFFLLVFLTAGLSIVEIVDYYSRHLERLYIFQHYMTTGALKMIILAGTIPFIVHRSTPSNIRIRILISDCFILAALVLTNTRSAWLGFLVSGIIVSLYLNRKLLLGLAILVLLFIFFAPEAQLDRAKSIVDLTHPSNSGRLNMWRTGWKIFLDHPVVGVGDIDTHDLYMQYKDPSDTETGGHLHNSYIMFLVTLGVIGFGAIAAICWRILLYQHALFRTIENDWLLASVVVGSQAVIAGILTTSVFEWSMGDHEIMVFFWYFVGIALVANQLKAGAETST